MRWAALIDIVLILMLTLLAGVLALLLAGYRGGDPDMLLVLAVQGSLIVLGVALLVRKRALSWRSLGLVAPRPVDLVRGAWALLLFFVVNMLFSGLVYWLHPQWLEQHHARLGGLSSALVGELTVVQIVLLMLFVAFYEELVARGALLSRSRALMGGVWPPVLLSSLLFGLGHVYQGWMGVLQTMLAGVVLARLTLHWGTLWPAIFAHGALNALSLIALTRGWL
ncbi:MAG: CPBP family intramembrane glutamic endopeptidase [Oleiphilaceae bacterium]|nr:CPBP family intramembrane glutamic endopeptidase [Oleiphilaceae bacterium]